MGVSRSIELNTAILCAALLFIKPLLRQFFPRLLGSSTNRGSEPRSKRNGQGRLDRQAEDSVELGGWTGNTVTTVRGVTASWLLISEGREEIVGTGKSEEVPSGPG
jgi:hypothetical protein